MEEYISCALARRLALAKAGLLKPEWLGFPVGLQKNEARARTAAHHLIKHFGYLQLDTVAIAGARSHAIVLLSRLEGFEPKLAEALLQPGEPLFEYWGHEASWIPLDLYPVFEFRRKEFQHHPWWGDLIRAHPKIANNLRRRLRDEGPLRSLDMDGRGSRGWWDFNIARRVASALWSTGELCIRERRNFQRSYDLAERVIPEQWRQQSVSESAALECLLTRALEGHGWATTGTLAQTWRLKKRQVPIKAALNHLVEKGRVLPCSLIGADSKKTAGWILAKDLELADRLKRVRPRRDSGVLLSPFDPVLWDRARVLQLFGFNQVLEIYKPAAQRVYGYYCLPILAGEHLIGRVDLKANYKKGKLTVLSQQMEETGKEKLIIKENAEAARVALKRYADALGLVIE